MAILLTNILKHQKQLCFKYWNDNSESSTEDRLLLVQKGRPKLVEKTSQLSPQDIAALEDMVNEMNSGTGQGCNLSQLKILVECFIIMIINYLF